MGLAQGKAKPLRGGRTYAYFVAPARRRQAARPLRSPNSSGVFSVGVCLPTILLTNSQTFLISEAKTDLWNAPGIGDMLQPPLTRLG